MTTVTDVQPSVQATIRTTTPENDAFGDQFLAGVVERRVVAAAIVAHECVRELVAADGDLRIDRLERA